eukprot:CCRYP_011410-RA/>CCRYP_011410-RA protein AED:0.06 eAED:0.06 QI:145/1/1/1/1/1/2/386/352
MIFTRRHPMSFSNPWWMLALLSALLTIIPTAALSSSSGASAVAARLPPNILRSSKDYHLLEVVPHDKTSFTQGLTYYNGHIYEGTGLEEESHILQHDPADKMTTLNKVPVKPRHLFGEGISYYYIWKTDGNGHRVKENRLIQLTWRDQVGFIYSLPDLKVIKEFKYDTTTGEGWGITFVEHTNEFYVSDGSEYLMVWDAETLEEKRRITVVFDAGSQNVTVNLVNELEFIDFTSDHTCMPEISENSSNADSSSENNECPKSAQTSAFTSSMRILANIWYQDILVSIDPTSGWVKKVYNLNDIYPVSQRHEDGSDCLNGISVTGKQPLIGNSGVQVWVTGKWWPNMFRIQLID